ncbi:DUF4286 family protein [Vibrio sp. S4M6]|uniref:DUF4286 family protein n=1 Tax=Vibrio sinus TaxID=2946865 RepID=UPI00202A9B37|nr:DUF4286 family protein [Vibrio sinus]MCL9780219.1 DUF4286 family protein [Vibrio sinus]
MILYEVNLDISDSIYDDYMAWLTPHIKEMLKFEGFIKADIFHNTESEIGVKKVTAAYLVDSEENLNHYLSEMAASMRSDGINRFGDKFSATRRVLRLTESYESEVNQL